MGMMMNMIRRLLGLGTKTGSYRPILFCGVGRDRAGSVGLSGGLLTGTGRRRNEGAGCVG